MASRYFNPGKSGGGNRGPGSGNSSSGPSGKSNRYRKRGFNGRKYDVQFNNMDPRFQQADNAWDWSKPEYSLVYAKVPAFSPAWITWDYTLTYQYTVLNAVIRGHLHYTKTGSSWQVGPGNYWVEGCMDQEAQTPQGLVNAFINRGLDIAALHWQQALESSGLLDMDLS